MSISKRTMIYLRVRWKHQHREEPVLLYSELDDDRFELRKVEVFRDGECGSAAANESWHGTKLGEVALPELNEIRTDHQFEVAEISRAQFEEVWGRRQTQQ